MPEPILDRLTRYIERSPTGCWLWTGGKSQKGYGQFTVTRKTGRKTFRVHRLMYELCVGEIPEGLQIDHLCNTKNCVNPKNLEAVTSLVNNRRSTTLITHCPRGHPYLGDNLYITPKGSRMCRKCRHRKREEAKQNA